MIDYYRMPPMYAQPEEKVHTYMPRIMDELTTGKTLTMFFASDYRGLRLIEYPCATDRVCGHVELIMTECGNSYSIATTTVMYCDYHITQSNLINELLERIQYAWAITH